MTNMIKQNIFTFFIYIFYNIKLHKSCDSLFKRRLKQFKVVNIQLQTSVFHLNLCTCIDQLGVSFILANCEIIHFPWLTICFASYHYFTRIRKTNHCFMINTLCCSPFIFQTRLFSLFLRSESILVEFVFEINGKKRQLTINICNLDVSN